MSDKKLLIKLAADVESLKRDLRNASSQIDSFASQVQKMGRTMGAAFSARAIGEFVLEVTKLAGEAEGVGEAFNRLPNSVTVMSQLKAATHGTVSELDLMKRAVMASNFDISLKALPQLLEFATLRAKQTGQSIDYLVDSIVTGIGRKSKLILDNLGISAVQLTEALGGASTASSTIGEVAEAVGKIASENLKKMGTLSENASTKMERLGASWINLKVAIGDAANSTGVMGTALDSLTTTMDLLATKSLSFWEKLGALMGGAAGMTAAQIKMLGDEFRKLSEDEKLGVSITRQATQAIKDFGTNLKAIEKAYAQNINYQKIMNEVNRLLIEAEKLKAASIRNEAFLTEELNHLREKSSLAIGEERANLNKQIQAIEKEIAVLQKLGIEKKKQDVQRAKLKDKTLPEFKQAKFYKEINDAMTKLANKPSNENKALNEMIDQINEARYAFQQLGIYTKKGLDQASAAFDEFLKDKDLQKFKDKMAVIKDSEKDAVMMAANFGDAFGQSFGDVITGAQSLAQAFSRMAVDVINNIEKIVLANMVANASKYGVVGIALAAAGFGMVKSLFSRIGNNSGSSSSSSQAGSSYRSSGGNGGMNLVAVVSGRQLNFVLKEQNRYDSRTNTTS